MFADITTAVAGDRFNRFSGVSRSCSILFVSDLGSSVLNRNGRISDSQNCMNSADSELQPDITWYDK